MKQDVCHYIHTGQQELNRDRMLSNEVQNLRDILPRLQVIGTPRALALAKVIESALTLMDAE